MEDQNKGFRGTPKKCNFSSDIDFNVTYIRDPNIPLGLMNERENVCFFNSVIQVLYSLPTFKEFIQQLSATNAVISEIKNLFQEIKSSNVPVRTSDYVHNLGLRDYSLGIQYDAH